MNVRVTALAAFALGMGACDPVFSLNVRQSLRPAPDADCLARALAVSSRVAYAQPAGPRPEDGFHVMLHDSVGRMRLRSGRVTRKAAADSGEVITMTYSWMGFAAPEPEEKPRMRAAAEALVGEVRAACAPLSPPAPRCTTTGTLLRERPCAA